MLLRRAASDFALVAKLFPAVLRSSALLTSLSNLAPIQGVSGFAALAAAISSGVEQATRNAGKRKVEASVKNVKIDKREAKRLRKAEAAAAAAAETAAAAAAAAAVSTEGNATATAEKPKKKRKASRRGGGGKKAATVGVDAAAAAPAPAAAPADSLGNEVVSRKKAKTEASAAVALPTPVGFTSTVAAPAPVNKGKLARAKLPGACFAFQKGECDRGDNCRYAHGASDSHSAAAGTSALSQPSPGRAKLPGACFAFQKGECDRGDSCRYAHGAIEGGAGGGAPSQPSPGRAKLPGVCFAFQKGECDRGDSCRYAHDGGGGGGGPKKPAKPMSAAAVASMNGVVKISKEVVPGTAYIRKIPDGATKTQVTEALERFGPVTSCRLVMDKETRQPNGIAFADFADDEDIKKVVAACQSYKRGKGNGVPCCGGRLQVDPALTTTGLSAIVNGTTSRSIKPVQKVKPKDRANPKPCHDFEKGDCVRGDRCRFFHDPAAAEARVAGKKREKKGLCFAFKKGECDRGDDCKFSHGAAPGGAAAAAAGRTPRLTGSGRPAKKAGICFAFQKGECDRGDNCKFNHVSQH